MRRIGIISSLVLALLSVKIMNPVLDDAARALSVEEVQNLQTNGMLEADLDEAGIMPLNNSAPGVSLTLGGAGSSSEVVAQPGNGTVYSVHTITMGSTNGENLQSYALTVSAPASISGNNGGTLSGAGGKTGSAMTDNTWGYAYNQTGSNDSMTFSSFTGSTQNLESGNGTPTATARNLILAAKFGESAEAGHYKGTISLSLTATPKSLINYKVTYNCKSGTGCPSNLDVNDYNTSYSYTIPSTKPTRSGYNFLGYSTSSTATTADSSYAPGKTISLTSASPTRTLYAVWEQITYNYKVTYNCKSGTGCPTNLNTTSTATSYSYTIPSTEPTRLGYKFAGYSTSSMANVPDSSYAPGKVISLTSTSPTITLYAVWVIIIVDFPETLTTMQGMTSAICSEVSIGMSKTLTDTRDNSTYTIAKLADGKCWMTQNLRIIDKTITSSNSNIDGSFYIAASATWTDTSTTGNHAYYDNDTDYGAYYTWYTATAGTSASTYDICPKGWRLPTGGSSGEFQTLYNKSTQAIWTTNNDKNGRWLGASLAGSGGAFFPAAGQIPTGSSGIFNPIGSVGRYWSGTPYSTDKAYVLNFTSQAINPDNSLLRYLGLSVRCVAK